MGACSVEKPTGATSFAWSEVTDATCKANAASKSTEDKCKGMKSCATCKADADCLWYVYVGTSTEECNAAAKKDDTVYFAQRSAPDTCPACAYSDCEMCQKDESCNWYGLGALGVYSSQKCDSESIWSKIDDGECPVESPAASVGISAAALAATALAMLMN